MSSSASPGQNWANGDKLIKQEEPESLDQANELNLRFSRMGVEEPPRPRCAMSYKKKTRFWQKQLREEKAVSAQLEPHQRVWIEETAKQEIEEHIQACPAKFTPRNIPCKFRALQAAARNRARRLVYVVHPPERRVTRRRACKNNLARNIYLEVDEEDDPDCQIHYIKRPLKKKSPAKKQ